jgi:hypothetical protein
MPRIRDRVPVIVTAKQVEPTVSIVLADCQACGGGLNHTVNNLPSVAGVVVTLVDEREANYTGTIDLTWS